MVFIRLGKLFGFSSELAPAPTYTALGLSNDPATVTSTASAGGSTFILNKADAEVLVDELRRERRKLAGGDPNRLMIDELPVLFAGDQLFTRTEIRGKIKRWIVGFLIRVATFTKRDKRPSVVNHVATVIRALYSREVVFMLEGGHPYSPIVMEAHGEAVGPVVDYLIAEALGKGGFQYRRLLDVYGDVRNHSIAIVRHRRATEVHRDKIVAVCESLIGKDYGYLKVGAHLGDYALTRAWNAIGGRGDVYAFRRLVRGKRYPMCSWATLYEYAEAELPFETDVERGSPDDLWDECRKRAVKTWLCRTYPLRVWVWLFYSESLRRDIFGPGFGGQERGRSGLFN